jgi:hypothetical protein
MSQMKPDRPAVTQHENTTDSAYNVHKTVL